MSSVDTEAIVTAVKERITGVLTGVRALPAGQIKSGVYAQLSDAEKQRRALVAPRVEVRVVRVARSQHAISEPGNMGLREVDLQVRCTYHLPPAARLDEAVLEASRARAADDADRVAQALGWPGGLAQTSDGVETRLVSGLLEERAPAAPLRETLGPESALLEWQQTFFGWALIELATT